MTTLQSRDWYFSTNGALYDWTQADSGLIGGDMTPINADAGSGLQNVIWNHISPGDRIFMYGGVYSSMPYLPNSISGTELNRTLLTSVPGQEAIFDGGYDGSNGLAPGGGGNGITIGGSFITVSNLVVRNSRESGITFFADPGVTISNVAIVGNVVSNAYRSAIVTGNNADGTRTHSLLVEGNTVTLYALHNQERSATDHWNNGIGIGSSNSVVRNNVVHRGYGEGIILAGIGNIAEENVVFDVYSAGIYLDGSVGGILRRNVIYSTYDESFFVTNGFGNGPASGIQVASELPADDPRVFLSSGNVIHDNFVIGGRSGFYYGDYMEGGGFDLSLVFDNTFFTTNATIGLIHFDVIAPNTHDASLISNNVFMAGIGSELTSFWGSLSGLSFADNAWSPAYTGDFSGVGDIMMGVSFQSEIQKFASALLQADPHSLVWNLKYADDLGLQGAYFTFLQEVQSIPEPATWPLLLTVLILGALCRKRRAYQPVEISVK
ncbi:right-handed parallel beta-helix repeat-containing protein [Kamptonema cortianum]|nr:right-handed parallel beta-helix repeat-containing protein [Kamptonema cortianum]